MHTLLQFSSYGFDKIYRKLSKISQNFPILCFSYKGAKIFRVFLKNFENILKIKFLAIFG